MPKREIPCQRLSKVRPKSLFNQFHVILQFYLSITIWTHQRSITVSSCKWFVYGTSFYECIEVDECDQFRSVISTTVSQIKHVFENEMLPIEFPPTNARLFWLNHMTQKLEKTFSIEHLYQKHVLALVQ